jgi:type IV pilus assembly protein PilM
MFSSKFSAFGLDLSDLSIKIALLKEAGGHLELVSFGRQEIPENVIEGGVIKKEDELIALIKRAVDDVQGQKIKTQHCIVSLPETESYIRMVQLPKIKNEEIPEAIKWELEANIPIALDDIYFDWQVVDKTSENQLNILVGALPKALVDPYLSVIKKAGLKPLAFEIESVATLQALIKDGVSQEATMIIDLGAKKTTLVIFVKNSIWLTTGLSVSSAELIYDIAKLLKIDQNKAKNLKFKVGLDQEEEQGKVYQAIEPRLLELVNEINKYIDYYQSSKIAKPGSRQNISKILLCGGGANMKGLSAFLSARLKVQVSVGNPWINIFTSSSDELPEIAFGDSLSFTTALGLALRGISESKK